MAGAVCVALVASASARAGEPREVQEAHARFDQGLRALDANDLDSARVAFAQAYAACPSVDILWNLAMTEARTGRHADALAHFRVYVDSPGARPERAARARDDLIPTLFAQTSHVLLDATPGATITLDGRRALGRAPLGEVVDVEPGPHVLRAAAGGRAIEATVTCDAGQLEPVSLLLQAQPEAPLPPAPEPPARPATRSPSPSRAVPAPPTRGPAAMPHPTTGRV
jgi:hypothetical protein